MTSISWESIKLLHQSDLSSFHLPQVVLVSNYTQTLDLFEKLCRLRRWVVLFQEYRWLLKIVDHVYFVHPSTDISTDIWTDTWPMYRPTYQPMLDRYASRQYIDRDVSVDVLTDTWPICQSIQVCRLRVVVWLLADMLINRLLTFCRYFTATCLLLSFLITTEFAAHDPSIKPSEIWGWPKKDEMCNITFTFHIASLSCWLTSDSWPIYHR